MEVKIDIDQYFTDDEVKELVEDEIRSYVGKLVDKYFLKRRSYDDFIVAVARDAYWEAVGKLGEDTMGMIRRQVRKEIMNLTIFSLIGNRYNYSTRENEPTELQKVINEESEKARPEIAKMVRDAALSKIESNGADIITDAFYNLISPVFEKEDE